MKTNHNTAVIGKKQTLKTKDLVLTAMMTAVLAIMSQMSIPLPTGIPVTMQTFAVALAGFVLGAGSGTASVGVYLLAGAIGLPVFTGFSGGLGRFVSPTGGFLYGFPVLALLCGLKNKQKRLAIPLGFAGLAICHLFGALHFTMLSGNSFFTSLLLVSVPYVIKDVLSLAAAYFLSLPVRKALGQIS